MHVNKLSSSQKKWLIPIIIISAVILLTVCTIITVDLLCTGAENRQGQQYHTYLELRKKAHEMVFTVTEGGKAVGSYSLEQLNILDDTLAAIDGSFDAYSRMDPKQFAETSIREHLSYRFKDSATVAQIPVATARLDLNPIMRQLTSVPREDPKDAYAAYKDGKFEIVSEVAGTSLNIDATSAALTNCVASMSVNALDTSDLHIELTEYNCYQVPQTTIENHQFDFTEELDRMSKEVEITVNFQGETETLTPEQLRSMMQVNDKGEVTLTKKAIEELVAQWHQTYRNDGSPYLFNAQVGGVKPIDFLLVDYEINQEATVELLAQTVLALEPAQIDAVWYCWRKGSHFAIEGEYVEIDIPNQKMTYVKDNEVVVSTDIVTGATWGYPTPPGLYKVENKDTNCWLSGDDYNVHVDYWIGFVGHTIGIHDADWRTKFGGTNYVRNGSHGCVNTPKEATALIFENIEVGVPVLVYGK